MAEDSRVVSRASWVSVVFAVVIVLIGILVLSGKKDSVVPVYSATSGELDLAVVGGIVSADKHAPVASSGAARAVVAPHHLVAAEAIALGIKALAPSSPRVMVILSPDHFGKCPKLLCTTEGSFRTFFGDVSVAHKEVAMLLSRTDLVASSDLFTNEHGIYGVIPFIKHYMPEAMVVPIVVSQQGKGDARSRAEVVSLLGQLMQQNDVALVVSSDFSHYLPLPHANANDQNTRKVFCAGSDKEILELNNPRQSDCPLCLWVAVQEAKRYGFWNPAMIWHSNSAALLHNMSAQETTSHFAFVLSEYSSAQKNCDDVF